MSSEKSIIELYSVIKEHAYMVNWAVLLGYRGSIAHGMYVPKNDPNSIDDKDIQGICLLPRTYYYGLDTFGSKGTVEIFKGEWDIVLYEFTKAIRLLVGCNPNIISILWLAPNHYMRITEAGKLLIENRDLFSSKQAYNTFVGYAHGQLHRMTHSSYQGYMGEKRKELVNRFGYDTKNAAHLIRILRMGIEFLSTGQLNVLRSDAQELLEIKRGEWSIERVQREADKLFDAARTALISSKLPDKVDKDKINDLCLKIVDSWC